MNIFRSLVENDQNELGEEHNSFKILVEQSYLIAHL